MKLILEPFVYAFLSIFLIKNESQQVSTNDATVKAVERANIKKHRKNLVFLIFLRRDEKDKQVNRAEKVIEKWT